MKQLPVTFKVEVAREIDGIEMGVLEGGVGYLSGRSLATLCGVVPSSIINQATRWKDGLRDGALAKMLIEQGITGESLFLPLVEGNKPLHAYPDDVCMVFLEYYAFEIGRVNTTALTNYRRLARASLRLFIYKATGYDPAKSVPLAWRQFHDRLQLNPTPRGYFSVFREMSDIVLTAIQNGLVVDAHTVPDISVGQAWGKHWRDSGLEAAHGPSREFQHAYPDYFPQAAANAFIKAKIYPLSALGEFRIWMETVYLPEKFPKYIKGKIATGALAPSTAELILAAFESSDEELPAPAQVIALPSGR